MFRFGKASWRKGCCDSCSMYIYEGNGPVASVPSQMRRCNTKLKPRCNAQIVGVRRRSRVILQVRMRGIHRRNPANHHRQSKCTFHLGFSLGC